MKKERDEFDDIFRSKLHNFEAETDPGDWEAIAERLPQGGRTVPIHRFRRYWVAAAVILLLIASGEIYYYMMKTSEPVTVAEMELLKQPPATPQPETATGAVSSGAKELLAESGQPDKVEKQLSNVQTYSVVKRSLAPADRKAEPAVKAIDAVERVAESSGRMKEKEEEVTKEKEDKPATPVISSTESRPLIADALDAGQKAGKRKRWGFGMGAGSYSTGTDQLVSGFVLKSSNIPQIDKQLEFLNSPNFYTDQEAPKTNIEHKRSLSFGLGVSYSLTDRWALQSGLTYTMLSSEWETNKEYHAELKQKIHYLGIPLGITYKIAEWQRFQLYGTAGFLSEYKLTGTLKTKIYSGEEIIGMDSEKIHMKPWQFSINTRVGISYPILRFVSAYVEGGAIYYFDNGSSIETIRTEKPFDVNMQVGLRLGF